MAKKITDAAIETIVDATSDVIVGDLSATTDAGGFLFIPSVAGAPTGTPTTRTGYTAICFDSSNGRLYAYYGGAWKYGAVAT